MKAYVHAALVAVLSFIVTAPALAQTTLTQIAIFDVPEANQGVAVDHDYFYAFDNRVIAKYTKNGRFVAKWEDTAGGPFIHLDGGVVVDGKIYAAHSNYRKFPLTSSIEVWDAATLKHLGTHSLGIQHGSLTWLDRSPEGVWYAGFANYDITGQLPDGSESGEIYGGKINTTIVKFDKNWQTAESWIFPNVLLDKFEDMSNSGGSFGPDGELYLSGHDPAEVYRVNFPEAGSVIELDEAIPANIRGQGIAWDPSQPGVLYGIIRATSAERAQGITHKVVVFRSNLDVKNAAKKPKKGRKKNTFEP